MLMLLPLLAKLSKLTPTARASVSGAPDRPQLRGEVRFYDTDCGTLAAWSFTGLPEGDACSSAILAMHIHAGGSCSGANFADSDGHWNPASCPHPYHAGDLPPLFVCRGRAVGCVLTGRFAARDAAGKTLIVHARPDDFTTQPSGAAGEKIACGVIELL